MTEKQFYDWQTLGGTDEVIQYVKGLGNDLIWVGAQNGDEIILKVISTEEMLRTLTSSVHEPNRLQSKRLKDLVDIARLLESHPRLWDGLPEELQMVVDRPV